MSMNRNEILEKLKEILLSADESSRDTIHLVTEQTHLLNDLGVGEFQTGGDVVNYIEARLP